MTRLLLPRFNLSSPTHLLANRGVPYLDFESGQTVLRVLRGAGLLDEVFLTETDVVVDE